MGTRILVLKLGAIGDALRTTPILHALQRTFPIRHITWVTDRESFPVLQNNNLVDRLVLIDPEHIFSLLAQEYDLLLSFDKNESSIALAMGVNAKIRRGFAMSPWGTLDIFNESSRYALALGLDDQLKFFQNKKTYQEIIYGMAEIPYSRDLYVYTVDPTAKSRADEILGKLNPHGTGPCIGLNTGCGRIFATKKWPDEYFAELAELLRTKLDARVFLLGGDSEREANTKIQTDLKGEVTDIGSNPLDVFAAIISKMNLVVTGDTLALHLAIGVKTKVVALFGPTCYQEIDFYGLGKPVVALSDCTPCYRAKCIKPVSCMADLKPEQVYQAVDQVLFSKDPSGDPVC